MRTWVLICVVTVLAGGVGFALGVGWHVGIVNEEMRRLDQGH